MAVKKSELYGSLWESCNELRGGMDSSQYKDYVLTLLFVKYVTDRFKGEVYADIEIPEGGSFDDMVSLKGKNDIGEGIDKVIGKLADANNLRGIIDNAKFNDGEKLGKGKDMVDKLTKLVAIFQRDDLNFKNHRAGDDDIIGDAYEYLMKHFATESGKSKGQFYTPAEVSRIMAQVIGINHSKGADTTLYDPTCGSGSLLIRAADVANHDITIYGQELDGATRGLAKMNMVLHNKSSATIQQGNVLSEPKYTTDDDTELRTFDYVVANPPFSQKNWMNGVDINKYGRFRIGGEIVTPPVKNGDYAFLLHVLKSLNSRGKGAIILPHGVLFRGAESVIREKIIKRGYIKGIIGLPANLFFGTSIPACIIVFDKTNSGNRDNLFMINASDGFIKDGNKNRLREQDIYKIVKVFNNQIEIPGFSKKVYLSEITKNEFNLNIPKYIERINHDDIQDITAHLYGGIPVLDVDGLSRYWDAFPTIREKIFGHFKDKYVSLKVSKDKIREIVYHDEDYRVYADNIDNAFIQWKNNIIEKLKNITKEDPKALIEMLSENIVKEFENIQLLDVYDVYQVLLSYWNEIMSDDAYMLYASGDWNISKEAINLEKTEKNKDGTEKNKIVGWDGKIIPKSIMAKKFFIKETDSIEGLKNHINEVASNIQSLIDEHDIEEGILFDYRNEKEKVDIKKLSKELKEMSNKKETEEYQILESYVSFFDDLSKAKNLLNELEKQLDIKLKKKFDTISLEESIQIAIYDKWLSTIFENIDKLYVKISHRLSNRIIELAERYERTLNEIEKDVERNEIIVKEYLTQMKFII